MDKKNDFIMYQGVKFTVQQGYYRASIQLHRWIWEREFGKVPEDHQIHHKNGIKTDNRLENLECIHIAEHRRLHNSQKEIQYQVCKLGSRISLRKKRVYYLLKEGKNVLSENSKLFWDGKGEKPRICVICKEKYFTRSVKIKNGCCSNACRCLLYRLKKSGLYNDLISAT